ncbi:MULTISPECIES: FecR family protein [unclassified Saccharicrinis]|uniref:FecR family protein n=1 Tax=unclassified Saccharicrinis TaxID=2646859 RepID=UPI003D33A43C
MSERFQNILTKYFDGKITLKEEIELSEQLADKKNNMAQQFLSDDWKALSESEQVPYQKLPFILNQIHHTIRLNEDSKLNKVKWWNTFQRVAAILIMPLLIAFLSYYFIQSGSKGIDSYAEIQCPMGVRTKFQLPDGTTGFLNSGSTLTYPVVFANTRKVKLVGEAYFDVVRNTKKPFIVNTPNQKTKVLGTQFNVVAYENGSIEEIILLEGKVEVYSHQGEKLETLQPNQKLVIDTNTKLYNKYQVEANQYISWTEGKLAFRNENMQQVADRLSRWYNIDIEIRDPELLKYAFRATFIDEPVEQVLKLLALTAPISYKEQAREKKSNGIYKKRKVIISIDKSRLNAF